MVGPFLPWGAVEVKIPPLDANRVGYQLQGSTLPGFYEVPRECAFFPLRARQRPNRYPPRSPNGSVEPFGRVTCRASSFGAGCYRSKARECLDYDTNFGIHRAGRR